MKRVLALAGCILLGSCGNQSVAGGGSDQPNSLDMQVLRADGSPATGAAARWVSGAWSPDDTATAVPAAVVGAEVRVDDRGFVRVPSPDPGVWHLEVLDSSAHQIAVLDTAAPRVVLQAAARWSGTVVSQASLPAAVGLAGTSRSAVVGPDRRFSLDWLPAGAYRVVARWGAATRELGSRRFDVGQELSNDTLDGDSDEVELVDLRRTPLRCALRGLFWAASDTDRGRWFQSLDSSSRISPAGWDQDPSLALKVENGRRFLSWELHVGGRPVDSEGIWFRPWAGIGLFVAPDPFGLDWSRVEAVRILARGDGLVNFQVNSHAVDLLGAWGHFRTHFQLDASWRWIEIPVSDLWPGDSLVKKGVVWSQAACGVYALALYAGDSAARIQIADIRLRGRICPRQP